LIIIRDKGITQIGSSTNNVYSLFDPQKNYQLSIINNLND